MILNTFPLRMAASQIKRLSEGKLNHQWPMKRYIGYKTVSNSCPPNFESISSISFLGKGLIDKRLFYQSISYHKFKRDCYSILIRDPKVNL